MNFDAIDTILSKEVTFYTDKLNDNDVYVEYKKHNGAKCFESIKSQHFLSFISYRYRQITEDNDLPDYKAILKMKQDDAVYLQSNKVFLHHRIAGSLSTGITYFLADDEWRYINISPNGYKIRNTSKVKFLKGTMDAPQDIPMAGRDYLDLILPRLNMDHNDALLYAIFLVHAFSRDSNHFCAIISSSKGTGKSTLTKISTEIISPATSGVTLQPTSEDDLKTMLANTYVAAFDNTAPFNTAFSNILCSAITGSKAVKRKLYTNSDQVVLDLHNLVLVNGIDIVPYKSDLAERSLYFELRPINASSRQTDTAIWSSFNKDKPYILGAIFETLAKAMQILPTLTIKKLHRMSEAHLEMTAIAMALGISQEEFQRILDANNKKLQDAYSSNNAFVNFVLTYLHTHPNIEGSVTKLYKDMEKAIIGDRSFFPKSPSMLSRRLNEEHDALTKAGYTFSRAKTDVCNTVKITRIPKSQQTKAQKDFDIKRRATLLEDVSSDEPG